MRLPALLAFAAVACQVHADISYQVTIDNKLNLLNVRMEIPNGKDPIKVQIPNWGPGGYDLNDFYKNVKDFHAVSLNDGIDEKVTQDTNTWTIEGGEGPVAVTYSVAYTAEGDAAHYGGPATYMYVVGRKNEHAKLHLSMPTGWVAYTGLDQVGKGFDYVAPTYDVLADNPVSAGSDLLVRTYTSHDVPHFIVVRGKTKAELNIAKLEKACKWTSDMEGDFFGGFPFKKYIWHFGLFDAQDGAGGLEHLNSTQIGISTGVGPRAVGVLSHEYFHAWNVKRIRSKVLGPFDYTVLPKTGALWWLEGVTDYYAHYLLYKYNWPEEDIYKDITSNTQKVRTNAAHLEISPYDSSYRVGEANNGRGNSNGYKISYYDQGWVAGLCFDLAIRASTDGKKSLDDVEMKLWAQCKDSKPGFEEGDIRKHLVEVGGPSLGDLYDQIIVKPGEMPVEAELAKIGLKMDQFDESYVDVGFDYVPDMEKGAVKVTSVRGDTAKVLQVGDEITVIGGSILGGTARSIRNAADLKKNSAKAAIDLDLTILRGDAKSNVTVTPFAATRKAWKVSQDDNASTTAKRLGEQWLKRMNP